MGRLNFAHLPCVVCLIALHRTRLTVAVVFGRNSI
jgi:hypothetical protein